MAAPAREYVYSVDQHMMEHLKYSGVERENLTDIIGLFVSLKNKYGLMPFDMAAEGLPVPNAVTARYVVDSLTLKKVTVVLFDTPRLNRVTIHPRGIIRTGEYELAITLGG